MPLLALLVSGVVSAAPWTPASTHSRSPIYSVAPDDPQVRVRNLAGRLEARVGNSFALADLHWPGGILLLTTSGFIELSNFDTGYFVPFQSYRAHVGIAAQGEYTPTWVDRLNWTVGWFHESDHAADADRYRALFANDIEFHRWDNNNFSSYEFGIVTLRLEWHVGKWTTAFGSGVRLFPTPINAGSHRNLRWSIQAETWVERELQKDVVLAVGVFAEHLTHEFQPQLAAMQPELGLEPFRVLEIEAGPQKCSSSGMRVGAHLSLRAGAGRGVDFVIDHGLEVGAGLRVWN